MSHKKRIEKKSSRTANYTCLSRASSFLEKNIYFKSNDYIAVKLLPLFVKLLLQLKILNLKGRISPKGWIRTQPALPNFSYCRTAVSKHKINERACFHLLIFEGLDFYMSVQYLT